MLEDSDAEDMPANSMNAGILHRVPLHHTPACGDTSSSWSPPSLTPYFSNNVGMRHISVGVFNKFCVGMTARSFRKVDLRIYPALAEKQRACKTSMIDLAKTYGCQYVPVVENVRNNYIKETVQAWTNGPIHWLIREYNGQRASFLADLCGPTFNYQFKCNYEMYQEISEALSAVGQAGGDILRTDEIDRVTNHPKFKEQLHEYREFIRAGGHRIASFTTHPVLMADIAQVLMEQATLVLFSMGKLFNNDELCIHSANAETSFTDRCCELLKALKGYAGGDSLLDPRLPMQHSSQIYLRPEPSGGPSRKIEQLAQLTNTCHYRMRTIRERNTFLIFLSDSTAAITSKINVNPNAILDTMLPYARDHYVGCVCDVRPCGTFVDILAALRDCISVYAGGDATLLRADVCICTSCNDVVRTNDDCYSSADLPESFVGAANKVRLLLQQIDGAHCIMGPGSGEQWRLKGFDLVANHLIGIALPENGIQIRMVDYYVTLTRKKGGTNWHFTADCENKSKFCKGVLYCMVIANLWHHLHCICMDSDLLRYGNLPVSMNVQAGDHSSHKVETTSFALVNPESEEHRNSQRYVGHIHNVLPQIIYADQVEKDESIGKPVIMDVSASVTSVAPALRSLAKGIAGAKALGDVLEDPLSYSEPSYRAFRAMEVARFHRRIQVGDYFKTKLKRPRMPVCIAYDAPCPSGNPLFTLGPEAVFGPTLEILQVDIPADPPLGSVGTIIRTSAKVPGVCVRTHLYNSDTVVYINVSKGGTQFARLLDNVDRTVTSGPTTLTLAGGNSSRRSRPSVRTKSRKDPLIAPDDQRIMLPSLLEIAEQPETPPQISSLKEHVDDEISDVDSFLPTDADARADVDDHLLSVKERESKRSRTSSVSGETSQSPLPSLSSASAPRAGSDFSRGDALFNGACLTLRGIDVLLQYAKCVIFDSRTYTLKAAEKIQSDINAGIPRHRMTLDEEDTVSSTWIQRYESSQQGLVDADHCTDHPKIPGCFHWDITSGGWQTVGYENDKDFSHFSRTAAFHLRHDPAVDRLVDGSVSIDQFVRVMCRSLKHHIFPDGSRVDLRRFWQDERGPRNLVDLIKRGSDRCRYQIWCTPNMEILYIRALQGHGKAFINEKYLLRVPLIPGSSVRTLYHQTQRRFLVEYIMTEGLKPGGAGGSVSRHEVFFSIEDATLPDLVEGDPSHLMPADCGPGIKLAPYPFEKGASDMVLVIDALLAFRHGCYFTQTASNAIMTRSEVPPDCMLYAYWKSTGNLFMISPKHAQIQHLSALMPELHVGGRITRTSQNTIAMRLAEGVSQNSIEAIKIADAKSTPTTVLSTMVYNQPVAPSVQAGGDSSQTGATFLPLAARKVQAKALPKALREQLGVHRSSGAASNTKPYAISLKHDVFPEDFASRPLSVITPEDLGDIAAPSYMAKVSGPTGATVDPEEAAILRNHQKSAIAKERFAKDPNNPDTLVALESNHGIHAIGHHSDWSKKDIANTLTIQSKSGMCNFCLHDRELAIQCAACKGVFCSTNCVGLHRLQKKCIAVAGGDRLLAAPLSPAMPAEITDDVEDKSEQQIINVASGHTQLFECSFCNKCYRSRVMLAAHCFGAHKKSLEPPVKRNIGKVRIPQPWADDAEGDPSSSVTTVQKLQQILDDLSPLDSSLKQEVLSSMQAAGDSSELHLFQHALYTDQGSRAISYPDDIYDVRMECAEQDLIAASRDMKGMKARGGGASGWVEQPSTPDDIAPVDEALQGFDEPPQRLAAVIPDRSYQQQVHMADKILTFKETSTIVVPDDGSHQLVCSKEHIDQFRASQGLEPLELGTDASREETRPAQILCDNCNAPNPYGFLFCHNCNVQLKDTLATGTAQQALVKDSTRTVRRDIAIRFRSGGDATHNFRGGRSADGDCGRNARKLHKRAVQKGFTGVADRYKNDIPWRLSMFANGHTPQSMAVFIERSLQPVFDEPLSYQVREQRFGGQYYATTDQAGGSGQSSRRDTFNISKGKGRGKDGRALVAHEHLRRHGNAFFDEASGEIRYHGGPPVPPPPPAVQPQWNRDEASREIRYHDGPPVPPPPPAVQPQWSGCTWHEVCSAEWSHRNRHSSDNWRAGSSYYRDDCWSNQSRSQVAGDSMYHSPSSYQNSSSTERGPGGTNYGRSACRTNRFGGFSAYDDHQRQLIDDDNRSYAQLNRSYGPATHDRFRCSDYHNGSQWWGNYDRGTSSSSSRCNDRRGWW